MFPLGLVLMPGGVLPLHVFEPRYQALVHDCLAGEPEFGVILITRGHEVGGGDQRCSVGVRVRIVQLADLGEGRLALVCIATDRIRIDRWLPDDPYPMAEVSAWEEPPVDHRCRRTVGSAVGVARRGGTGTALPVGRRVVTVGFTPGVVTLWV